MTSISHAPCESLILPAYPLFHLPVSLELVTFETLDKNNSGYNAVTDAIYNQTLTKCENTFQYIFEMT